MKRFFLTLTIVFYAMASFAAEDAGKGAEKKSEPIGFSAGIDYYSLYLWRGTRFFNGDGAFVPKVSWNAFNTGLVLSVAGEISSSWVFNGFSNKPGKYAWRFDSSGTPYRKQLNFNHLAYATQSLDAGADYSYTIRDAVTIGASVWYWWYFNSGSAREYARPKIEFTDIGGMHRVSYVDISFLTTTVSIGLPVVPYINPTVSLTHDYYTGLDRGGDYYVQLAIGHPFELTKEVVLTPGLSAGYYYNNTAQYTNYSLMWDLSGGALDTTESFAFSGQTRTVTWGGIKQIRTPLKKGFSDITPSLVLAFAKGPLSLSGGFYWCIVPARTWYSGAEVHRLYARVGIACAM